MSWRVELTPEVLKDLKKLDKSVRKQLMEYFKKLESAEAPLSLGKKLANSPYHRFRSGDYRLVCRVFEEQLLILVVLAGHRKEVYKSLNKRT